MKSCFLKPWKVAISICSLLLIWWGFNQQKGQSQLPSASQELREKMRSVGQCGQQAKDRGAGQKVISYNFYGEGSQRYFSGIRDNIKDIQEFFPGWLMRLYVDIDNLAGPVLEFLYGLKCAHSEVFDLCTNLYLEELGSVSHKHGMLWRLLPLVDSLVDVCLIRDLDSRPTLREVAAVTEWLETHPPLGVHMMRDHPSHNWHVMGGLWGARLKGEDRVGWRDRVKRIFYQASNVMWLYLEDQRLFHSVMWPDVHNDTLVHDSYHCINLASEHMRPFPTRREEGEDNFVGAVVGVTGSLEQSCPVQCRPQEHQDWDKC